MEKNYFDYEPSLLSYEGLQVKICFDVEHSQEEREEDGKKKLVDVIKAYCVRLNQPLTRSRIVDAIVSAAYPNDVMQAVVNNYLASPDDEESLASFNTMQEWRKKAKAVATEIMQMI